jgi:hypothetical protein
MRTCMPLSARQIAVVSPITPASMTMTSGVSGMAGQPIVREMHEPLEGIAAADALLGRPFPLPAAPLPLARWVDVVQVAERGVEVAWNLDDTRAGSPARLALYAGLEAPPERELPGAEDAPDEDAIAVRTAALPEAQPSLRPVTELRWERDGLHLRLTAQGPWETDTLLALARSV